MHGSCLGNGQYDVDLESLRDGSRFAAHCMIATWWRTTTQEERHAPLAALDNILQASHQRCTSRSGSPAQSVSMQSMHFHNQHPASAISVQWTCTSTGTIAQSEACPASGWQTPLWRWPPASDTCTRMTAAALHSAHHTSSHWHIHAWQQRGATVPTLQTMQTFSQHSEQRTNPSISLWIKSSWQHMKCIKIRLYSTPV